MSLLFVFINRNKMFSKSIEATSTIEAMRQFDSEWTTTDLTEPFNESLAELCLDRLDTIGDWELWGTKFADSTIEIEISKLKSDGWRIFVTKDPFIHRSYFFFYKPDVGIGYAQYDRSVGWHLTTVHRPNRTSGTGFSMFTHQSEISLQDARQTAQTIAPRWAGRGDAQSVVKFKSIEEFLRSKPVEYVEI